MHPRTLALLGCGALLGAAAAADTAASAWRTARRHPPAGRFVEVHGAHLHYLEAGGGDGIVLLHGNGATAADFAVSGVFTRARAIGRVIAFDRPGFGHSERPAGRQWTPAEQARLLLRALIRLDVTRPVIIGHSWGALVALEMALRAPSLVQGLVLVSGHYFPTRRIDVALASVGAAPVVGGLLCRSLLPVAARLALPNLLRRLFAPDTIPAAFRRFPIELALRPSQLRATSEETRLLNPAAAELAPRYGAVAVPTIVIAGTRDRLVDPQAHSVPLARTIPYSNLRLLPGGHMIHHAAPEAVIEAVRALNGSSRPQAV
jgi:pimeloyl-ACP methyl ester carboxylesterase